MQGEIGNAVAAIQVASVRSVTIEGVADALIEGHEWSHAERRGAARVVSYHAQQIGYDLERATLHARRVEEELEREEEDKRMLNAQLFKLKEVIKEYAKGLAKEIEEEQGGVDPRTLGALDALKWVQERIDQGAREARERRDANYEARRAARRTLESNEIPF